MSERDPSTTEAAERVRHDGYVVLPNVLDTGTVDGLHALYERLALDWQYTHGDDDELPLIVTNLVERAPRTAFEIITTPRLLDLADLLLGPSVQLDNTVLFSADAEPPEMAGVPVHWHRDRFGYFPDGTTIAPRLLICFFYLQEMPDEMGPLRVVPGSHREPVAIRSDALTRPHPDEVQLPTHPGDAVVIHHNLLHSGTHSVAERPRRFLGVGYNTTSMRHDEILTGPNVAALRATARRTGDRRVLRLLGEDDLHSLRANAGFTEPEDAAWERWRAEDRSQGSADAAKEVDAARTRIVVTNRGASA